MSLSVPHRAAFRIIPALLLVGVAVLGSCYPGDELTVSEADVVITAFDESVDFGDFTSYALGDSVVYPDPGGGLLNRSYSDEILGSIRQNLDALGFADNSGDPDNADVLVSALVTTTDYQGYYSYNPCYYYCWYYPPGWGWYYPPAVGSYTFTVGTVMVNMVRRVDPGGTPDDLPVVWVAALNGLSDNATNAVRIQNGIDQAFDQSKYLGKGK
jgi:hypothetical protein